MSSLAIALVAFACMFGGALTGLFIQRFSPTHHLRLESRDAIKVRVGLIGTMAGLVLGLLVGSAKVSFDSMKAALTQRGAKLITLDRILAQYGPEAIDVRDELRRSVATSIALLWPKENTASGGFKAVEQTRGVERVREKLQQLSPQTESQRSIQSQAIQMSTDLLQSRWLLIEQGHNSLPIPLLVILIFWLTILNIAYGLLAPRNRTVIAVSFVCSLSLSGASNWASRTWRSGELKNLERLWHTVETIFEPQSSEGAIGIFCG
jgi:hypothetical protein